eukprot:1403166-Ditylum_brightwellii.AAC.1
MNQGLSPLVIETPSPLFLSLTVAMHTFKLISEQSLHHMPVRSTEQKEDTDCIGDKLFMLIQQAYQLQVSLIL